MPRPLIGEPLSQFMAGMAAAAPPGDFIEAGVYQGGSALYLYGVAQRQGRGLWLYDTFAGLPEPGEHDTHNIGDFADTSIENVRELMPKAMVFQCNITGEMTPAWRPGQIAFAHIDVDLYTSTLACIDLFWPLVVNGGVMLFDDYRGVPGAIKAIDEKFLNTDFGRNSGVLPDGRRMVRKHNGLVR